MSKKWVEYWKALGKDLRKVFYLYPKLQVLTVTWKVLTKVIRICDRWRTSIVCYIGEISIELDGRSTPEGVQEVLGFKDTPGEQGTRGPSGEQDK